MTSDNDPMLDALQHLAVLAPDATRGDRVKARCRAALERRLDQPPAASARFTIVETALACSLSIGYLGVIVHDVLNVYLRR